MDAELAPALQAAGTGSGRAATLVWFRQDLRLADNPALAAAVAREGPVIPVYIWAPDEEGDWPPGAASKWWLARSLAALGEDLKRRGSRLIVRRGPSARALLELARETGADAVVWNRRYEPAAVERDRQAAYELRSAGIAPTSFQGSLLFDPAALRNRAGQPFRVFTPFWRACLAEQPSPPSEDAPTRLAPPPRWPASLALPDLDLEPKVDWAAGLRATWQPGEAGAARRLEQFLAAGLPGYAAARDLPATPGTSRLSPHLHFGEISPGQVWRAALEHMPEAPAACEAFLRQLVWREFAYHMLCHFPSTPERALRPEFDAFPWRADPAALRAWQRGRTGYPLVDAGMRELWHTGWMHNRVRMVAASFLAKHLLIDWREGARWFWDTLVDADLANNTFGWQWVAGSGADAAPYFRIFNPEAQARKFDPAGEYVHRWAPAPDSAGAPTSPIVEHGYARRRALAAYERIRRR